MLCSKRYNKILAMLPSGIMTEITISSSYFKLSLHAHKKYHFTDKESNYLFYLS